MTSKRGLSYAWGALGELPQAQGGGNALLGGMADRVTDQPFAFFTGAGHPALAKAEGQFRMVLGNVAQMIGDAAPDVLLGIIPQCLQDRDHRPRILDKGGDAHRPRESGAGALTAQAAHVRIRILRPVEQAGQGSLGPADEEWAHRELGTESAGQFILGGHRGLKRIAPAVFRRVEAVQGDEGHMGQVEEYAQPEPLCARQRRGQRSGEDGDGVVVGRRQVPPQDACEVLAAPEDGQRPQALVGVPLESVGIEGGMNHRQVVGEALDGLAVEESGE